MCGIVGQVNRDGRPVEPLLLGQMCAALEHRGPDARGMHVAEGAGLGIQRLRVIDLVTGDQPIFNEDGTVAVVLNGEIYNYREIRERLAHAGHEFTTQSDTEVIAHLYEEEGSRCVEALHGMFALAIWDARRRRLTLARDRVGKKPLFYAHRDGAITLRFRAPRAAPGSLEFRRTSITRRWTATSPTSTCPRPSARSAPFGSCRPRPS